MNTQFSLQATRAYSGTMLRDLFFSIPSYVLYGLVLLACTYLAHASDNIAPVLVGLLFIGGMLHIVQQFNKHVLFASTKTDSENLADLLTEDIVQKLAHKKEFTISTLIEAVLETESGAFTLSEMGTKPKEFLKGCTEECLSVDLEAFLQKAKDLRGELHEKYISPSVLIFLAAQYSEDTKKLLNALDLSQADLLNILEWEKMHKEWNDEVFTWHPRKLLQSVGTIGRGWVLGYTESLDAYTTDLSERIITNSERKVQLHKEELKQATHILSRASDQNFLILGKVGVGKNTFVENLAYHIRKNEIEHSLPYTRVLFVHTAQLLAGSQSPDAVLLDALTHASKAGKFILVIDNLSLLLSSGNKQIISVFSQFLKSPTMSLIALAEAQEYHVLVKHDPALDQLFEKIFLNEPPEEDTIGVMMTHYFTLEHKKHVHITYRALKSMYALSDRYIGTISFPGKALSIMDDAVLTAKKNGRSVVNADDVREMVSMKARIDVQDVSDSEKDRLLQLDETMKKQIIGQDAAIEAIVNTLKRARMDIHAGEKPLGTFLFLGPTGVGKTQTAKVLAEQYFGDKSNIIRLDMNEYSSEDSMKLIVGSPTAGDDLAEGYLARKVQEKPFSLILLDEIEKAHPNVLNVFLQILDEGQLTDSLGAQTDFKNAIIIATSNAGALFIRDFIKNNEGQEDKEFKRQLIDAVVDQKTFSPEFINRFDEVILYHPLSIEDAKRVAIILLDDIIAEFQEKRGVSLKIEEDVLDVIIEHGYSEEFGARQMRRAVIDMVETYLADYLLKNEVKRGEEILIRKEDLE